MFFKRKRDASPKPAASTITIVPPVPEAPAESKAVEPVVETPEPAPPAPETNARQGLKISSMDDFEAQGGQDRAGVVIGDKLMLGPHQGRQTLNALPVNPGDAFEFSVIVDVATPATRGETGVFFAGPVYFDAAGEVVKWWEPQPGPAPDETSRTVTFRSEAPAGAETVRIGLHGSWAHEVAPADFILAFRSVELNPA